PTRSGDNRVAAERSKTSRILVVDDDEPMLRVLRVSIELSGHTTLVASSREKALETLEAESPDLILMDYRMGGMAPETFITTVRESGFEGPIVLCTAMDQNPGLDVDDVLFKPFNPEVLITRLN